jgi:hypothetical protein
MTAHTIVIETPSAFVPSTEPTTEDVIQLLALLTRDHGTWWLRDARIYDANEVEA